MGIKARDIQVPLEGTTVDITKTMKADPRRVGGIKVVFHFPATLKVDDKQKEILQRAALTCPVAKSIHPDIEQDISFNW